MPKKKVKARYNISDEERKRRSERAKEMIRNGKLKPFGGGKKTPDASKEETPADSGPSFLERLFGR
jgi:hypothetical protein